MVDSTRSVWKAPANVSLAYVIEPAVRLDDIHFIEEFDCGI